MAANPRKKRSDAAQNRERLVEAAREAFADGAVDEVTLKSIAGRAGVGIGTLYRHFPTREALVEAVYRDDLRRLEEQVDGLLGREPPEVALRSWMDSFADYVRTRREMADALPAVVASGAVVSSDTPERLTAAIGRLLAAGVEAGTIRPEPAAADVFTILAGIFFATRGRRDRASSARALDIVMAGLRRH